MLVIICFLGMFISAAYPVSKVRYFGYFSKLWVCRYYNQKTGYVQKTVWNGWYFINLVASARGTAVIHQLIDTYGNGII